MPAPAAGLRFPRERVLLPRTKLAYVHLRNLLSDAKRDRTARVSGYVSVWLPDELLLLFLQRGELVNATRSADGRTFSPLPIGEALAHIPAEPELGEICFHAAADEQLACMHAAQTLEPDPWPTEIDARSPQAIFPLLGATAFDGMLEIAAGSSLNYLLLQNGTVQRGYMVDDAGTLVEQVQRLFNPGARGLAVRRWAGPPELPVQAPPALLGAYRELANALVAGLVAAGSESAPAIAEQARQVLTAAHPALAALGPLDATPQTPATRAAHDSVADAAAVTAAIAAWSTELLWTATPDGTQPETLLRAAAQPRRHAYQAAGYFELLPWRVDW